MRDVGDQAAPGLHGPRPGRAEAEVVVGHAREARGIASVAEAALAVRGRLPDVEGVQLQLQLDAADGVGGVEGDVLGVEGGAEDVPRHDAAGAAS